MFLSVISDASVELSASRRGAGARPRGSYAARSATASRACCTGRSLCPCKIKTANGRRALVSRPALDYPRRRPRTQHWKTAAGCFHQRPAMTRPEKLPSVCPARGILPPVTATPGSRACGRRDGAVHEDVIVVWLLGPRDKDCFEGAAGRTSTWKQQCRMSNAQFRMSEGSESLFFPSTCDIRVRL